MLPISSYLLFMKSTRLPRLSSTQKLCHGRQSGPLALGERLSRIPFYLAVIIFLSVPVLFTEVLNVLKRFSINCGVRFTSVHTAIIPKLYLHHSPKHIHVNYASVSFEHLKRKAACRSWKIWIIITFSDLFHLLIWLTCWKVQNTT